MSLQAPKTTVALNHGGDRSSSGCADKRDWYITAGPGAADGRRSVDGTDPERSPRHSCRVRSQVDLYSVARVGKQRQTTSYVSTQRLQTRTCLQLAASPARPNKLHGENEQKRRAAGSVGTSRRTRAVDGDTKTNEQMCCRHLHSHTRTPGSERIRRVSQRYASLSKNTCYIIQPVSVICYSTKTMWFKLLIIFQLHLQLQLFFFFSHFKQLQSYGQRPKTEHQSHFSNAATDLHFYRATLCVARYL